MLSCWIVKWDPRAVKDLKLISHEVKRRIFNFFEEKIHYCDNPRVLGEPLVGSKAGLWRYRVGDYRIICLLKDIDFEVLIVKTAHRKEVYKKYE